MTVKNKYSTLLLANHTFARVQDDFAVESAGEHIHDAWQRDAWPEDSKVLLLLLPGEGDERGGILWQRCSL